MKTAALHCWDADGDLVVNLASESVEPLCVIAKRARAEGQIDGQAVARGIVFAAHVTGAVVYKFRVEAPSAPAQPVGEDSASPSAASRPRGPGRKGKG
jgi:hypothetical protein